MSATRNSPGFIQRAEIVDNRDSLTEGRLKVWLVNSQKKITDKGSWITARYASPFSGRTKGTSSPSTYDDYPKAYGFWAVPPDVGVEVFVFFVDGKQNECYWFSCSMDTGMNACIPSVPSDSQTKSSFNVPITEYDKNTVKGSTRPPYLNVPLMEGIAKQNLIYDELRGLPNTSARRQAPATVYGLSTPRGSSISIDDGYTDAEINAKSWEQDEATQNTERTAPVNNKDVGARKNEEIRLRTRSGGQILISETEGNIFVINRDGTARVELTADGRVLIHSDNTIAIRSEVDVNIIADRDINMTSGRNMNLNVTGNYKSKILGTTDELMVGAFHQEIQSTYDKLVIDNYTLKVDASMETLVAVATKHKTDTLDVIVSGNATIDHGNTEITSGNINVNSTLNIIKATTIEATLSVNGAVTTGPIATPSIAVGSLSVGAAGGGVSLMSSANGVSGDLVISGSVWASDFNAGGVGLLGHTHDYTTPVHGAGPAPSAPPASGGSGPPGQGSPNPPTDTQASTPPTAAKEATAVTPPTYANVLDVAEMNPTDYARKILSAETSESYGTDAVVTKDTEILDTIIQEVYPTKGDPNSGG